MHFSVKRKTIDSLSPPGRMIDARFHRRHSDKKGQNLQFYSRASRTIDFAGSIMLLIPVIAFALAKGTDMAFVSMATGLMTPAQGASSGASAQAASGNFNAGNVSMGNTSMNSASANKSDLSSSWNDPYASKSQTAYGSVTRDETGTVTGMARTSIDLGVTSSGVSADTLNAANDLRNAGSISSHSARIAVPVLPAEYNFTALSTLSLNNFGAWKVTICPYVLFLSKIRFVLEKA